MVVCDITIQIDFEFAFPRSLNQTSGRRIKDTVKIQVLKFTHCLVQCGSLLRTMYLPTGMHLPGPSERKIQQHTTAILIAMKEHTFFAAKETRSLIPQPLFMGGQICPSWT